MIQLFAINSISLTDSNLYLFPQQNNNEELFLSSISASKNPKKLPRSDKFKLIYYVNRLTNVQHLYIPPSVTQNILAFLQNEGYLRFSRCYKIIACFWFIHSLKKFFCSFIWHCPQCPASKPSNILLMGYFNQ